MKEGPVPVPSYRPYVYRDDDVVPVWAVSHLREPLAWGVIPLVSVQVFMNHFSRA